MVVNRSLLNKLQTENKGKNKSGIMPIADLNKTVSVKPQRNFTDKIDNSYLPFVPKIRVKSNGLVPLADIFSKLDDKDIEINKELFEENIELLMNPYLYEIEQFRISELMQNIKSTVQQAASLDQTTFKYIDQLNDLIWLCNHLGKDNRSKINEIAVDLEHHSYRSFLGFTCLMQISTRNEDFIIDTIKLRAEMHRLNEIFTDWTLLKVMHGADMDIEWLQKDFGIYVVNMFDTGQAARILQYPHFSLSYLLQKFCGITAQKQYQLADWRQRPLNDAMLQYAREDTHYLLYIYDNLRNELVQAKSNPVLLIGEDVNMSHFELVFEKSKMICKKTFKKPIFYTKGFLTLCQNNSHLNAKQMKALCDLYAWRDKIARESDESCEYVLKNHQLLKIAELLPREIYGILALCNPLSNLVEANVHEMHEIIKNAREFRGTVSSVETGLKIVEDGTVLENNKLESIKPEKKSVLDSIVHLTTYDPNHILNCPHDFPHNTENQESIENMNTQHDLNSSNLIQTVANLNIKEILIKPSISKVNLPDSLIEISNNQLNELLRKDTKLKISKPNNVTKQGNDVDLSSLSIGERVRLIKESMENPYEMYLPIELRPKNKENITKKWNLIKPASSSLNVNTNTVADKSTLNDSQKDTSKPDINMIPIKLQNKLEKKAKKKSLKVDFRDAIIEYNKSKVAKLAALGNEEIEMETVQNDVQINSQQAQLENLIEDKVRSNLKMLSQSVIGQQASAINNSNQTNFTYNSQEMNKIFSKPSNSASNDYDPSKKFKKVNYGKVNKRRQTNAVTRSKNNLSATFKTSNTKS